MLDVFYEESARVQNVRSATSKYNTYKVLSIIFYALSIIWVVIALTCYSLSGNVLIDIIAMVTPLLVLLPSGIFFSIIKNRFYVDYDYTFITGTIKIAKVIKNIKRKFLFKFDTKDIEKLGKYGSNTYKKYEIMAGIEKLTFTQNTTPAEGKDFYYLVATVYAVKKLMIFECTETFMVNVLKFSNKSIVEEDFR